MVVSSSDITSYLSLVSRTILPIISLVHRAILLIPGAIYQLSIIGFSDDAPVIHDCFLEYFYIICFLEYLYIACFLERYYCLFPRAILLLISGTIRLDILSDLVSGIWSLSLIDIIAILEWNDFIISIDVINYLS